MSTPAVARCSCGEGYTGTLSEVNAWARRHDDSPKANHVVSWAGGGPWPGADHRVLSGPPALQLRSLPPLAPVQPSPYTGVVERIAARFHELYERLAPEHGYQTRKASAVPWCDVPVDNRMLMLDVVRTLLDTGVIQAGPDMVRPHHG